MKASIAFFYLNMYAYFFYYYSFTRFAAVIRLSATLILTKA